VNFAELDEAMTSQVARSFELKELFLRQRNAADGRAWDLSLTPRGARLVNEAVVIVEQTDSELFEEIQIERPRLLRILNILHSSEA